MSTIILIDEKSNDKKDNKEFESKIAKSLFLLIGSIFFKELYYICIIILQKYNYILLPSNKLFFLICFYQIVFSTIFIKLDHINIMTKKHFNVAKFNFFLIRCIVECFKTLSIIFSLSNIPYVSCRIILLIYPIFVSYIYLKLKMDTVKRFDKICYLFTFLLCIIFFFQYMKGTIYSVFASMILSIGVLLDKKICKDFHPYFINFLSNIFGLFVSSIFIIFYDIKVNIGYCEHILSILCSISGFFYFYKRQKYVQLGSLLERSYSLYISLFLIYTFSFLILDSNPSLIDVFATLILIPISYYSKLRLESSETEDDL